MKTQTYHRLFLTAIFLVLMGLLPAQDLNHQAGNGTKTTFYSYGPEGKTYYKVSTEKILIKFTPGLDFNQKQIILAQERAIRTLSTKDVLPAPEVTIAMVGELNESEIIHLLNRLEQHADVVFAHPFFQLEDGTLMAYQDRILVKLNISKTLEENHDIFHQFNLKIKEQNKFDPDQYVLETSKELERNTLEIANELYKLNNFRFAAPDYLILFKPLSTNDPYLGNQWSLNNTTTPGADMNVFNAWSITTGAPTVKIAIIDNGVDLIHPDLQANILPGYDATGLGSGGAYSNSDWHGTAVAGVAAAVGDNEIGIAGVAYHSKIIPVRMGYYTSNNDWIALSSWIMNAINWSWQIGEADIMNCSFGWPSASYIGGVHEAIEDAVSYGRGGLGSIIVCASGNNNSSFVHYPANHSLTIGVGSISSSGNRSSFSTHGDKLSVVAPGHIIYSTRLSSGVGYGNVSGTSFASPNTAGVVALILSVAPNLTFYQAKYVLESTAKKIGNYTYDANLPGKTSGTWNYEMGYGLVDAYAAVQLAMDAFPLTEDASIHSIVPNSIECDTSTVTPILFVANLGSDTIFLLDINYQFNNDIAQVIQWTGMMASATTQIISLPPYTITSGSHSLTAYTSNPNGNMDQNPGNDTASTFFAAFLNNVNLSLNFDNWPQQTTWDIKDASNNVLYSGGPYLSGLAGTTLDFPMCLGDACYTFTIYDSNDDGICCKGKNKGSYTLTLVGTGTVLASGGSFGSSESTNFCLQPEGAVCDVPAEIAIFNITASGASLSWNAATNAVDYNVRIREAGGSWTTSNTGNTSYTFSNLDSCTDYEVEVESDCDGTSSGYSATTGFSTIGCPLTCDMPDGISVSGINNSSATVSWSGSSNALSYNVRIRPQGGTWTTSNTGNTTYTFSNLDSCTDYEVEVESVCDGTSSGYSATTGFSTIGCPQPACDAPTGLFVSNVNKKNARINWGAVSGATQYQAQIWPQGSTNVNTHTTSNTNIMINGLNEGTTYEWHVRANCSGDWSPYSVVHSFVAGSSSNFNAPGGGGTFAMFRVSPNPTTGKFTINFNNESNMAYSIRVFDMLGKMIHTIPLDPLEGHFKTELDISTYPNGIYFIHVLSEDSVLHAEKILKMN